LILSRPDVQCAAFDAAIVLGAMVLADGSPSPALTRRVLRAAALVREGRAAALLMSGGPVAHSRPEAWVMRDLAVAAGIPADRVMIEDQSRNTIENARLSLPIAAKHGWRNLAVVTDSYHLPRALYVFRRFGCRTTGIAARPTGQPGREWWAAWVREAAALPWTVLRVELDRIYTP
jgi:uncharacterized SAM-binding protein YcdF (DUF218 family)